MSTTVGDLINKVNRAVHGTYRGQLNKLQNTITDTDASLICTYDLNFGAGAYLELDDEIVYVYTVNSGTKAATAIERGRLGTTAASHTAGALIHVESRFPRPIIKDTLEDEIRSWPPHVYRTKTIEVSFSSIDRSVDCTGIDSSFYRLLRAVRAPRTSIGDTSDSWPELRGRIERNMNTSDFASGVAFFADDWPETPGFDAELTFAMPFDLDPFTSATAVDDPAGVGLESFMLDVPVLGAASRLLEPREIARTSTAAQGVARRATEVPPDFIGKVAQRLWGHRLARLEEVGRVLAERYPMRGL